MSGDLGVIRKTWRLRWESFLERVVLKRKIERIFLTMGGHIFFQTLSAAVQLDLFSLISRHPGLTRPQLRERLGIAEKPTRIILLGCTALGLLKKKGDRYFNSVLAERVLCADQPENIIPVIKWQHFINYRAIFHLHQALLTNRNVGLQEFDGDEATLYGRLAHHPELERIFQDAMESISTQANRLLAEAVDFSRFRHLVDVGGGNGANIIRLARKYPGLRATVFDSDSVCKIARERISEAGLSGRLDAVAGDCFADPFPEGADCFLFAHFMTIWSESRDASLLRKAYDALPRGGAAIVFNMMQSNDESGPLSAAMGSPYFLTLATAEGMLYTWREYEQWLRDAGFTQVMTARLVRDHGVIVGIK